jgi:tetratricopeptide (TPR) repeat protein
MFSKTSKNHSPLSPYSEKIELLSQDDAIVKAQSYYAKGQYVKALRMYESIPEWEKNKRILIHLASIARKINRHEAVIHILHAINGWNQDKNVLNSLARSYENLGQFDKALQIYGFICANWMDGNSFINRARCYQKMGLYLMTINSFQNTPGWENNKKVLLGLALCYQKIGQYTACITTFQKISLWKHDKDALLGLARCYQEMGDYPHSITLFMSIPDWEKDKAALLGLAHCYSQTGQQSKADLYFNTMRSITPYYQKNQSIARFVIKQKPGNVETLDADDAILNSSCHKIAYLEEIVLLLWAIQWMVLGYQVTSELEKALYNWNLSPLIKVSEVIAVITMQHTYLNKYQQFDYLRLLKYYGLENKLLGLKEIPAPLPHSEKNTHDTFFKYYNPTTRKGISACAIEKSAILFETHSETSAYLIKHYKHLPHIEGLDLDTPNCRPK